MYKCKCGREFEKSQSYVAHCGHCKIHLGKDPEDRFGGSRAWNKGKTKEDPVYGSSLRKIGEATSMRLKDYNPLVEWNTHKPESSYAHQSSTRKEKYRLGKLTPAPGVGRGKYSYLCYNDNKILLRSTYEFIYALYLLYNSIDFNYESIRVTYEDKTYISDFLVEGKIIEIKGNYHADVSKSRRAFESLGYEYEVKFWKDIVPYYEYLKSILDIDSVLESIRLCHDNRNYYVYKYVG